MPILVLSVGGSLVAPPSGLDAKFLRTFRKLISTHSKRGWKFVIVVGGGSTARAYQTAARAVDTLTKDDADWLGIHATRLNGHLMRTIFREIAHPIMFKDPSRVPRSWKESVLIAAGWKPGWSTDYVATRIAKRLGATLIVNLSNIDYLYDHDPRTHKNAKKICEISWKDFRNMVGNTWDPGMNVPFDPVASRLAHQSKMTVVIANGKNMKNLQNILEEKLFIGTVIA
jgi:uridylate kinase